MPTMINPDCVDALIFDMDGTLWDAVDSYCAIWNATFSSFGVNRTVSREQLVDCMGLTLDVIYSRVAGDAPVVPACDFIPVLVENEKKMMSELGGVAYDGVRGGIEQLSEKYVILLLSNCGEGGLENMARHIGISGFVTECVSFGGKKKKKDENMLYLKRKYNLAGPVYVGDTDSDCRSAHKAGLPFVFASYGFGNCSGADLTVASFDELTEFFLNKKV